MTTLDVTPLVIGISSHKRCIGCGDWKPPGEFNAKQSRCRNCQKQYHHVYYLNNRDHVIAKSTAYQHENADAVREAHAQWREKNAEHYRQYHRAWRRKNPAKARGAVLRYAKSEKGRTVQFNRMARLRGGTGKITTEEKRLLRVAQMDRQGHLRCWWCGIVIQGKPHLDHKIALVRGGSNRPENLCYTCPTCNKSKQAKSPAEFAGRLL